MTFTELLPRLRDACLYAGLMDPVGFWELSLRDIMSVLEASRRRAERETARMEAETRMLAVMLRNLACQITEGVAVLFSKEKKEISPLDKYYPGMFTAQAREMDLEAYTDMFLDYAWRANARHAGEEVS